MSVIVDMHYFRQVMKVNACLKFKIVKLKLLTVIVLHVILVKN